MEPAAHQRFSRPVYEGLPWFAGAAIAGAGMPHGSVITLLALYSLGAHGIMTLNDFKSVDGDKRFGIRSLPVQLGPERAARVACALMAAAQLAVIASLFWWGRPLHALAVLSLLLVQVALMAKLLGAPRDRAPWYNATGTTLYVLGMLACAFALPSLPPSGAV